jgi:hypothetical protein
MKLEPPLSTAPNKAAISLGNSRFSSQSRETRVKRQSREPPPPNG